MTCSRGKANPDDHTKIRLWAASAGFCQRPTCNCNLLLTIGPDKRIHIAEMAHIVAAADAGPRASTALDEAAKGAFENLILLCPTCHTIIDKAPDNFPDDVVREWKAQHQARLDTAFGVARFDTRGEARLAVEPLLTANAVVFTQFGPHREEHVDPESDYPELWRAKAREELIPNNEKCIRILSANRHLLTEGELVTLELFKQHAKDFALRHTTTDPRSGSLQFPRALSSILE